MRGFLVLVVLAAASSRALARPTMYGTFSVPGAAAFLLVPADHERPAGRAALDVQRADALGGVQLVAGEREQIDVLELAVQVDRHLADRLRGVGVEDDRRIGLLGEPRELLDGKDHARLVVGVHDRDQQRVGPQGADELADVEIAVAVDAAERSPRSRSRSRSLQTSSTAGCSTAVVMMWRRLGLALAVPKIAVLLLSVAQEVKRICCGSASPKCRAISCRACVDGLRPRAGPARTSSWG